MTPLVLPLLFVISFILQVKELDTHEFTSDVHIPEVLVFCTGTDLHSHPLYINGNIVLQDKVSVHLLYHTHTFSYI